jgi:adhesin/invasin
MTGRLAAAGAALALVVTFLVGSGPSAAAGSACPDWNPPNELVLAGGTPQSAKLGTAFAMSLAVSLANTNGCPITIPLAGIAVTFTAPASGPSGTFSASGSNAVLVGTSATGDAAGPQFTANTLPGGYVVVASSDYGSVSFSLVNTAGGVPAKIVALAPANQTAAVSNRYARPLRAEVLDANGAPVPGAAVTFELGPGGDGAGGAGAAFQGGSGQADEQTDASGIATSPPLIADGVAGRFTATAIAAGSNATATFSLENLAAKPPRIAVLGRAEQSATVGREYRHRLAVKVRTAQGGALQGIAVTFTLGSGSEGGAAGSGAAGSGGAAGATFVGGASQLTETTNARGIAVSPRFVANTVAGVFTATATTTGTTNAVPFRLDNLAARPPTITAIAGPGDSATVGARYATPLRVRIRESGKPVQGASVTFTFGAAGSATAEAGATFLNGATQATEATNASGIATSPAFSANTIAGTFTATATTNGTTSAASFTLRSRPGRAATVAVGAASGESTVAGRRFPIRLAVTVTDRDGNRVAHAVVTFRAPAAGPSGDFVARPPAPGPRPRGPIPMGTSGTARVATDSNGIALAPPLTANHRSGGYVVIATVRGTALHATFALVNLAH